MALAVKFYVILYYSRTMEMFVLVAIGFFFGLTKSDQKNVALKIFKISILPFSALIRQSLEKLVQCSTSAAKPLETSSLHQYNNEYFMKKQQAILCLTKEFKITLNYSDFVFCSLLALRHFLCNFRLNSEKTWIVFLLCFEAN